jgi:uncharacterized protein GlcG (DUF336 family)
MKLHLSLMSAALALAVTGAAAQGADPKFVMTGKAAEKVGEFNMINSATARAIADACLREVAKRNLGALVVILDNFGYKVYQHRLDAASRFTAVSTAEMLANTAFLTRKPSSLRLYNIQREPFQQPWEFGMGLFPNAGGLPIYSGKQIIGFIGVGGMNTTPEFSDEICAHGALTEVVGPQPPLPPIPPAGN